MPRYAYDTPTFKTEALRLVTNVQLLKRLLQRNERLIQLYLCLLWQALAKRCVTKAMPIHIIDGKCHIKKRRSRITCFGRLLGFISRDWLFMASGADTHTQTHTHIARKKTISINQVHAGRRPARAWFKK